jgi:hypothetical protein
MLAIGAPFLLPNRPLGGLHSAPARLRVIVRVCRVGRVRTARAFRVPPNGSPAFKCVCQLERLKNSARHTERRRVYRVPLFSRTAGRHHDADSCWKFSTSASFRPVSVVLELVRLVLSAIPSWREHWRRTDG